jgi:hypothetical protein
MVAILVGGWGAYWYGSGIYIFSLLASASLYLTSQSCSAALYTSLFGLNPTGAVVTGAAYAACGVAATMTVVFGSVAAGIGTYGSNKGWVYENDGATVNHRGLRKARFHDTHTGVVHYTDPERHDLFHSKFGSMLKRHNTTLVAVTYMELHDGHNHTGSPIEGLNMTHGRTITLQSNDSTHTAFGHIDSFDEIFNSFDSFKANGSTPSVQSGLTRRDTRSKDWASYTVYGENMQLGRQYSQPMQQDLSDAEQTRNWAGPDSAAGLYVGDAGKYCIGMSPEGNNPGQNSIIVGEVYWNQFGGLDTVCQGG